MIAFCNCIFGINDDNDGIYLFSESIAEQAGTAAHMEGAHGLIKHLCLDFLLFL